MKFNDSFININEEFTDSGFVFPKIINKHIKIENLLKTKNNYMKYFELHNFTNNKIKNDEKDKNKNTNSDLSNLDNQEKEYQQIITKVFDRQARFTQFYKKYYVFVLYEEEKPSLCIYDPKNNTKGDNYVDFGIYKNNSAHRRFVNGLEYNILLDFNVDGVIYDLI